MKWTIITTMSLFLFFGCERARPRIVNIPSYPEIDALLNISFSGLGKTLEKEVMLDGIKEAKRWQVDSTKWAHELEFIEELNPNRSEYIGAFDQVINGPVMQLSLKKGEKGALKALNYEKTDSKTAKIHVSLLEDKGIYIHCREVYLTFFNGKLKEYAIKGYQKTLMKDTIFFSIKGRLLDT